MSSDTLTLTPTQLAQMAADIETVIADNDRLRAENARFRFIVAAVADEGGSGAKHCTRPFDGDRCRVNERWSDIYPGRWAHHGTDCLVTQARAALEEAES